MKIETTLKDGRTCTIREAVEGDGKALLEFFLLTHGESDFLRTYPDEASHTAEDYDQMLAKDDSREVELFAYVDGILAGNAGVSSFGKAEKTRHRAEYGITVRKDYWGLGIGKALTEASIAFAKKAGYAQLELQVVADNTSAYNLYSSFGFLEYGRNPKGFRSRISGWQELVSMRLELA